MAKIRRIIPFSWWPANWGMSGARRAIAEAEYGFDGEDLERKLIDINHPDKDSLEYKLATVKIDRRFNKVSEFDYEYGLVAYNSALTQTAREVELAKMRHRFGKITAEELDYEILDINNSNHESEEYIRERLNLDIKHRKITDQERDQKLLELRFEDLESKDFKLAKLDLDRKHGTIDQNLWEKETATLNGEPWFNVIGADSRNNGDQGQRLAVELDWNEFFPRFLETQGWGGESDDAIVDAWFTEAMRQMVMPDLSEEQLQAMEDEEYMPPRSTKRKPGSNGRTEYS